MTPDSPYDLKSVKMPYLSGAALKAFARALEGPLGNLLIPNLLQSAGINGLRQRQVDEDPTNFPIHFRGALASEAGAVPEAEWPRESKPGPGFHFNSAWDYAKAYRSASASPEEVARNVLDAIASQRLANSAPAGHD
jgi:hypothetical protein